MIRGAIAIRGMRLLGSGTVRSISSHGPLILPFPWTGPRDFWFMWRILIPSPGIPKLFAKSRTLKTEVVESKTDRIAFKLQQEYTPKVLHMSKPVNSLITLTLDDKGKVKYHKDMWNEKDYSHEGLGKIMKTLNGDQLTKVSCPAVGMWLGELDVVADWSCRLRSRRIRCDGPSPVSAR